MINYINIPPKQRSAKIYRIIEFERLLEILETGENTLVKPKLWDDPFENFLFNTPIPQKDGTNYESILRERAYGQCWTLNIESDAMWRIYAPNKNGVKIRSSIINLYKSLHTSVSRFPNISCYIGKVKYSSKQNLAKMIGDVRTSQAKLGGSIEQAKSLLIKRNAFKYEREIRLIYLDPRNISDANIFSYTYKPLSLIEHITFDPRMNKRLYALYRKHLKDIGYTGSIIQSGLYRSPNYLKR